MNNQRPPLIERVAAGIATHPRFVLPVVLALALLAGWGTSTIKIYTARNALFPKQVDVYRRLENFLQKFGAVSELVVVVENGSPEDLKTFATGLAARLRRLLNRCERRRRICGPNTAGRAGRRPRYDLADCPR